MECSSSVYAPPVSPKYVWILLQTVFETLWQIFGLVGFGKWGLKKGKGVAFNPLLGV